MQTCTYIYFHRCEHMHTDRHRHIQMHTHIHIHIQLHIHTHAHTDTHIHSTDMHKHIHIHYRKGIHAHMRTNVHTSTQDRYACMFASAHACSKYTCTRFPVSTYSMCLLVYPDKLNAHKLLPCIELQVQTLHLPLARYSLFSYLAVLFVLRWCLSRKAWKTYSYCQSCASFGSRGRAEAQRGGEDSRREISECDVARQRQADVPAEMERKRQMDTYRKPRRPEND